MSTLLLGRSDVPRHVDALTLLAELRDAFRTEVEHRPAEPARLEASVPDRARVTLPGSLWGLPAYSVRLRSSRPGGAVDSSDVVHLYAVETGALLAVMDRGALAAMCTGLLGALAADVLARPDASRVALIGTGAAASLQLKSLRLVRSLQHVRVHDEDLARAVEFSSRMYQALNLPVRPAESVEEAVEDADIVVLARASREPYLFPGMLRGGTHVTVLGTDAQDWTGLSAGLVRQSTFVCDQRDAAVARLGGEALPVELGEVLAGTRPGRSDAAQVTLFGAVGLPFQEVVMAWHVYQGARLDESVQRVDFAP